MNKMKTHKYRNNLYITNTVVEEEEPDGLHIENSRNNNT